MFIKDQNGQTLFFVSGPRFRGYLVPDAQHEKALRSAVERFKQMQTSLAYFTVPLIAICIPSLDTSYGSFALAVLTITLAVAAGGKALQRRSCFNDLLAGLARIEPLDIAGRWRGLFLFSLIATAYGSFVIWRIFQAFE